VFAADKKSSEVLAMKSLVQAVVIAATLAAPVAVFAQSNQPLTRAQVREQLVQVEQAGYNPSRVDPEYPLAIQAAEARVAEQNSAVGGAAAGSSQEGQAAH
jgi:hypothetical protein